MNELISNGTYWTYPILQHNYYFTMKRKHWIVLLTLIFSEHLGNSGDILGNVQSLELIIPRLLCGGQNVSTFLIKKIKYFMLSIRPDIFYKNMIWFS